MCIQPRPCRPRAAWFTLAATALILLAAAAPARAAQVNIGVCVANTGSDLDERFKDWYGEPSPTIADAITRAETLIADDSSTTVKIVIAPDTYVENLVINDNNITLYGYPATEPYNVIIKAAAATQPVIDISGSVSGVTLEGITITGGTNGIEASTASGASVTISRCYIRDNTAHGIFCRNATVSITNCPIANNKGDGIVAAGSASVTVIHCSIIGNGGNGINQQSGSTIKVQNSFIYQNGYAPIRDELETESGWVPEGEWEYGIPQGKGGVTNGGSLGEDPGTDAGDVFGVDLGAGANDGNYDITTGSRQFDNTTEVSLPAGVTTFSTPISISNADSFAPQTVEIKNLKIDLDALRRLKATLVDPLGNTTGLFSGIGGDAGAMGPTWLHNGAATSIMSALPPYADPAGYSPQQPFTAPASIAGDWKLQLNVDSSTNVPVVLSSPSWNHSEWNPAWTAHPDGDANYGRGPADASNISLYRGGTSVNNPMLLGDYTYTVDVRITPGLPDVYEFGIVFRSDPTGANCFKFLISGNSVPQTEVKLIRTVGGVDTLLWSDSRPIKLASGMITGFGVTCTGGSIQPFVSLPGIGAVTAPPYSDMSSLKKGTVGMTMSNSPDLTNIVTFVRAELDADDVNTSGTLHSWSLYFGAPYHYLTSPSVPCTGHTNIQLQFERWLNQDAKAQSVIEYSIDNKATWQPIDGGGIAGRIDGQITDTDWIPVSYSVGASADHQPAVHFRWGYRVDRTGQPAAGWNIRHVRVTGVSAANYGIKATPGATISGNYVDANNANYSDDTLDDGDILVGALANKDPDLINSPFIGKVRSRLTTSLLQSSTPKLVDYCFTYLPKRAETPIIGADEPGDSGTIPPLWESCVISPKPCPRMPAGELDVYINCSGTLDFTNYPPVLRTQSGIDLELQLQTGSTNGFYHFKNADLIESTSAIDCVEGNATVLLYDSSGVSLDYYGPSIADTQVLIDTIAPVVREQPVILGSQTAPFAAALPGVIWQSAPAINSGSISVPYELPTNFVPPQTDSTALATGAHAPSLDMGTDGITYFYNTGSISNNYTHDGLSIYIEADVHDLSAAERFSGAGSYPVSGFSSGNFNNIPFSASRDAQGVPIPLNWRMTGIVTPNVNVMSSAPVDNAYVQIKFVAPIPYVADAVKFGGGFVARDAAGNVSSVANWPVQVWWDRDVDLKVETYNEQGNPYPVVHWAAPTPVKNVAAASGNPAPLAFYKVYYNTTPGEANKGGSYKQLREGWEAESDVFDGSEDGRWVLTSDDFRILADSNPQIRGCWVAVVVGMMDECGNVTPWPFDLIPVNASCSEIGVVGEPQNTQWCLAYIGARSSELNTTLSANIQYIAADGGAVNLGPAPIVAYPPTPTTVGAVFTLKPIAPRFGLLDNPQILLELDCNGETVWRANYFMPDLEQFNVMLPDPDSPFSPISGAVTELGAPNRNAVYRYVFRATFSAGINGEQIFDPTPATFAFQLVPGSVEQYLRSSRGEQPIKSTEPAD